MNITFPQGIFYECIGCGDCCRRDWQICVEEEKRKSIEDFAASHNISRPLQIHPVSKNLTLRNRGKDGCVFLKADNLCLLHEQLGMKAKPMMCQTFPFKSIKTPDGYYIRVSFGCQTVRKNTGRSIESYSEDITSFINRGVFAAELKFPVFFQHNITIDASVYTELVKNFFLKELRTSGINSDYFLKIWNVLWLIFYQAGSEQKSQITIEMIQKNINASVNPSFAVSTMKRNMFYAIFLGYELVGRETKNPLIKYRNLINLVRNRGIVDSKYGKLKLQDIEKIKFDITNPAIQELLVRYYGHIIESGWMLVTSKSDMWVPTVINSWGLLALFYGLTVWFSKMFAFTRISDAVELEDVQNAIMIVDIEYVSHISREWLFLDKPIFARIFEQLSNTPAFVPTINRGE